MTTEGAARILTEPLFFVYGVKKLSKINLEVMTGQFS